MNERTLQHEITRTFRAYQGDAYKSIDAFKIQMMTGRRFVPQDRSRLATPEVGRPDYYAAIVPFNFWVEAKWAAENFGFDQIREEQRAWLTKHATGSWLWLFMGEGQAGSKLGRHAWMIPWPAYQTIEATCLSHDLKGIAYHRPHKVEHRELGLSAMQLFAPYTLTWHGNGIWRFPNTHPIWSKPHEQIKHFHPDTFQLVASA